MAVLHDPTQLPADLPAPKDDGGARHLLGMRLPMVPLTEKSKAAVRDAMVHAGLIN